MKIGVEWVIYPGLIIFGILIFLLYRKLVKSGYVKFVNISFLTGVVAMVAVLVCAPLIGWLAVWKVVLAIGLATGLLVLGSYIMQIRDLAKDDRDLAKELRGDDDQTR
ncbi:MAG: hypothetical protein ABFD14_01320 [Anaerolineaceae bacterium]